ncbi:hypothetical protein ACIQNU_39650 [Streptomyces sp. NPDC091292]|uniref:hypothetical protein n=1 Tax=Streptomyces sp. NPDC091292 TaxID=3365991 RepID=UPI0037F59A24
MAPLPVTTPGPSTAGPAATSVKDSTSSDLVGTPPGAPYPGTDAEEVAPQASGQAPVARPGTDTAPDEAMVSPRTDVPAPRHPGAARFDIDTARARLDDPDVSPERLADSMLWAEDAVLDRMRQVAPDENPMGVVARPEEVVELVAAEHLRAGHLPATALLRSLIKGPEVAAQPAAQPQSRPVPRSEPQPEAIARPQPDSEQLPALPVPGGRGADTAAPEAVPPAGSIVPTEPTSSAESTGIGSASGPVAASGTEIVLPGSSDVSPESSSSVVPGSAGEGEGEDQPGSESEGPDVLFAPPARRVGLDPVRDWLEISASGGSRRSSALRAIDRAVSRLPRNAGPDDLRRVLVSVTEWKSDKGPGSGRWDAVSRLEAAVRDRMDQLAAPARVSVRDRVEQRASGRTPERGGYSAQPGPSSRRGEPPVAAPLVSAASGAVGVEGFGPASGFEAELHRYRVELPRDAEVEEFGDIVELPGLLTITLDRAGGVPVLEIVTKPARGLVRGSADGRAERSAVLAAFNDVLSRLGHARPGARVGQIFPESAGYVVDPLAEDLPVRINEAGYATLVHHTATAPTSRLVAFIEHVRGRMRRESTPVQIAHADAGVGVAFGAWVREDFARWLNQYPDWADAANPWDGDELEGTLALGYIQVAATVRGAVLDGTQRPKDFTAVASRDSLAAVRSSLGAAPRAYLEHRAPSIAAYFASRFDNEVVVRGGSILDLPLMMSGGSSRARGGSSRATVRQYLDNLLLATPERIVTQYQALGMRTDFRTLETNPDHRGVPRLEPPVVRMETRPYASTRETPQTIGRDSDTLAVLSLNLYNEARLDHGLPPVGRPLALAQPDFLFAPPATNAPPVRPAGSTMPTGPASAPAPAPSPTPLPPALLETAAGLVAMDADARARELASLPQRDRDLLAADPAFVEQLRAGLSVEDFTAVAARLLVVVPDGVEQPEAAREEAEALVADMLADPQIAVALLTGGRRLIVVPRNRPMTSLEEFAGLKGRHHPGGGRSFDAARGLFHVRRHVAGVGEENLLGETTDVLGDDFYDDGYSIARHEWTHAIVSVLSAEDRQLIREVYDAKTAAAPSAQWPDGPAPNHSSSSAHEYFAQLSSAYLGANTGKDSNSRRRPRNNGSDWVEQHDPALLPLLRRLYGPGRPSNLGSRDNPYILTGFRQLWDRAEGRLTGHALAEPETELPASPARTSETPEAPEPAEAITRALPVDLEALPAPPTTAPRPRPLPVSAMMTEREFKQSTAAPGLRSSSRIADIDEELRAFHALPGSRQGARLLALKAIAKSSRAYVAHKQGEGSRVEGTQRLAQQADAAMRQLDPENVFRDLLTEIDGALSEGRNPDLDRRIPAAEAQNAAQAVPSDRFHAMMSDYVHKLGRLRDDRTLPAETRAVIEELMAVEPLVTVLQYPRGGMPGIKLNSTGDSAEYTFNVDTQARGGTSFLLGHIAHEFTHVAAHQAFGSSPVMELVRSGATDAEVGALAAERRRTLNDLKAALAGDREFSEFQQTMLEEKLVYGAQPHTLERYANNFERAGKITTAQKERLVGWGKAAGDASGTLVEYDTVLNQMLIYLHMWQTSQNNPFYVRLRAAAQAAYERRSDARGRGESSSGAPILFAPPSSGSGSRSARRSPRPTLLMFDDEGEASEVAWSQVEGASWYRGLPSVQRRRLRATEDYTPLNEALDRMRNTVVAAVDGGAGREDVDLLAELYERRGNLSAFDPVMQALLQRNVQMATGSHELSLVRGSVTGFGRHVAYTDVIVPHPGPWATDRTAQGLAAALEHVLGAHSTATVITDNEMSGNSQSGELRRNIDAINARNAGRRGYVPLVVEVSALDAWYEEDSGRWVTMVGGVPMRLRHQSPFAQVTVARASAESAGLSTGPGESWESADVLPAPAPRRAGQTEETTRPAARVTGELSGRSGVSGDSSLPTGTVKPDPGGPGQPRATPAEGRQPPLSQEEQLSERGLTPVYVLPGGDVLAHALTAVAPAETGRLAGYSRPAAPEELRTALATALAADLRLPPDQQRLWSEVAGRTGPTGAPLVNAFGGSADEAARALRTGSGPEATDWLTLAVAAPVLGLRLTVLTPDGSLWTTGPEAGRPVALLQQQDPAPYTARWAATEPTVQARQARRPDLSQPGGTSGYSWGTTSADSSTSSGTTTPPAAAASGDSARPAVFFGSEPRPSTPDSQRAGTSSATSITRTPPAPAAETSPVSAPAAESALTPPPVEETSTPPRTARDTRDEQHYVVGGDIGFAGVPSDTQSDDPIRRDESRDRVSSEPTDILPAPPAGEGRPAPESTETVTAAPHPGEEPPASPDRTPWYMAYDATGQFVVADTTRDVPFSERLAHLWAGRITQSLQLPEPAPGSSTDKLRAGIREAIRDMLVETKPTKWDDILAVGQTLVVDGRLVWLRPMMHGLESAPSSSGDVKEYQVGFSSTHTGGEGSSENIHGIDTLLFTALNVTGSAVATAFGVAAPQIQVRSAKARHHAWSRTILAGRKPFINSFTTFTSGLDVRVYVNGEEATHPDSRVTVPRNLHVKLPEPYTAEHGPRPDPHGPDSVRPQQPGKDSPSQARETLNAVNMTPVIAGLHRNLLGAGIPAPSVREIMGQIGMDSRRGFLSELTARNRYAWWSGEDSSGRVEASGSLMSRKFRGHVRLTSEIDSLQYVGDTEFGTRDDIGAGTNWTSSAKGSTTGGLGAGYNTAGTGDVGTDPTEDTDPGHPGEPDKGEKFTVRGLVPAATALFSSDRKIGHSLGVEHLSHTVLNTSGAQSRYRAGLRLVATVASSTHTVSPVDVITNGELSVVQREATTFVSRTVGPEWTADLRPKAAPSGRRHRVFTPPGRRSAPKAATSRPPFKLGMEMSSRDLLQKPGPSEPLAMASRRGFGFGVPIAFAGAEKLQGEIREAIEQHHARAVGDRKAQRSDWAGADRDLATFYGRAALEADPYQALLGIHRKAEVGGRVYRVSAQMQWGNRVEGPNELTGPVDRELGPSDNSYQMRVNARAVGGSTVTGERSRKATGRFAFGAGAVLSIPERAYDLGALHLRIPRARLQLGAIRGFFKGGWGRAFQLKGAAKQYRRTETDGKVDELRYTMTVRWTVTPESGKSSYIAGRLRTVARVVNPQEHAPAEPVTLRQAWEAGRVHASLTRPSVERPLHFSSGTHGLYPSFHVLPELAQLAARMYARQHGLSENWLRDPSGWPEEVRDLAHPVVLSARFDDMTGQFGEEIELSKHGDHKQAFRIKLHTHAPRDLGASQAVEVEHYLKGSATHVVGNDRQWGLGLDGVFGPQFRYGADGQQGEGHHGPGGRITVVGHAEGGVVAARGASRAKGMIDITRATYGGAVHTLRTTPVFEVTYVRWHGKRLTETTEYLSSADALDLLVPKRRLRDVLPPETPAATETLKPGPDRAEPMNSAGPNPASPPASHRTYLSADLIPGIAHPEVLRADGVMEEITARLRRQGVVTENGSGSESRPNQLMRTLHKSFSSPALQADVPALMTNQGVSRWIPMTGLLGSSRYLWVKVTATRLGAGPTQPRDDVKLTLRGELDDEEAQKRISGWETGFGVDIRARAGGNGVHGGPEAGATYSSAATTVREEATKRVPIYRANPGDTSWEFEHDITFRVETGLSTELPEILTAPARLPAGITRRITGNPATDLSLFHWYDGGDGTVGSSALVEGSSIRLLVPRHMTVMTDQPSHDIDLVTPRETEVTWQSPPAGKQVVSPAPRQEWPDALLDELHPWTTPAAASIARWAAATAIRQRTPLTVDGAAPQVSGLYFTTRAGLRYDHYTGANMLRPNIRSLLRHEYEVPVGDHRVLVGFDLDSAEILGPPEGTSFKQRTYVQEDEEPKHETERSRGWKFVLGPEVGGESGQDNLIGRAPVVIKEWLDGRSRSSALGDTDERNREGRRSYRHYRFDITAVVNGPYGTVRLKVPGGLYGMLPVDNETGRLAGGLEEAPELSGLLAPPPATPGVPPPPVPSTRSIPEVVVVPPSPPLGADAQRYSGQSAAPVEERTTTPAALPPAPPVPVAPHRLWTAQQLTEDDLPVDRSGLGIPDPEGIYDADDPVDQVRHLMLESGRWPQEIHAVAARTTLRIWSETFERFADTVLGADPTAGRSDIRRHWDEALGLITRGEPEFVLTDPRYAGDRFRDAVRHVATLLTAGVARGTAAEHAYRLRHELGLRALEDGVVTDTAGLPRGVLDASAPRTPEASVPDRSAPADEQMESHP